LLVVARGAAGAGVRRLRAAGRIGRSSSAARRRDLTIVADGLVDRAVTSYLLRETALPLLSEESGEHRQAAGLRWIVDPLDGSVNYSRSIPLCAVSIALWHGDTPVLGVVHDPMRDEVFTGLVGVGAWMNGTPIQTSDVRRVRDGIVCTGFPAAGDFSTTAVEGVVERVRAFQKVRMLGAAAISLAYVACGRADAYVEQEVRIWDVAAGLAIVVASGGQVKVMPGLQATTRSVAASNGRLPLPRFARRRR
jgi:myo-inositol-1(or 4)-monophosphatase